MVEGPVLIGEALAAGISLRDVFFVPGDPVTDAIAERCAARGARVLAVGDVVLRAIADATAPRSVVAVADAPAFTLDALPDAADLVLVLAQLRDPGNAGTLVRTAAAAGAGCVVFSHGSVDPFGPKTVRASAGGAFKVPIARAVELPSAVAELREKGFRCIAAEGSGSTTIYEVDLTGKVAVLVGNEAWGLSDTAAGVVDDVVRIPMAEGVESLNAATAGAIFLFESVRQRRLSSRPHG